MNTWLKATFALAACAIAFPAFSGQKQPHLVPQSGYLSPEKYTNAFLGFSIPLPQDLPYHVLMPSQPTKREPLLVLETDDGRTGLKIVAGPFGGRIDAPYLLESENADQDATERLDPSPFLSPGNMYIGGKVFARQAFQKKAGSATLWVTTYVTTVNNYTVFFSIQSLDPDAAEKLDHCIEGTRFFEPSEAKTVAGADSRPFNPLLGPSAQHGIKGTNETKSPH